MGSNYVSPALVSPSSYNINQYLLGNIVQQAYRLAGGLILAGQGINPSEQAEILDITNHFIDGLKLEANFEQFTIRTVVQVVAYKQVYGVGPGQDWDIERPEKITNAGFVIQQGTTSESEISMFIVDSFEQWQQLVPKLTQSSIPLALYYQGTTPYGSATVWPVPEYNSANAQGASIAIYSPGYWQEFTSLDDPFVVPHGYREFCMYNLAVRIHQRPPYNKQPMDASVPIMAAEYKTRIANALLKPLFAVPDQACIGPNKYGLGQPPKAWDPYS